MNYFKINASPICSHWERTIKRKTWSHIALEETRPLLQNSCFFIYGFSSHSWVCLVDDCDISSSQDIFVHWGPQSWMWAEIVWDSEKLIILLSALSMWWWATFHYTFHQGKITHPLPVTDKRQWNLIAFCSPSPCLSPSANWQIGHGPDV